MLLLLNLLCLFGCASMFSGTKEQIKVRSEVQGTTFYLNENELMDKDSITVIVPKKHLSETYIIARKPGCEDGQLRLEKVIDPYTFLGIPVDLGLISILLVDWLGTGAFYQAKQTDYILNPKCN